MVFVPPLLIASSDNCLTKHELEYQQDKLVSIHEYNHVKFHRSFKSIQKIGDHCMIMIVLFEHHAMLPVHIVQHYRNSETP